MSYSKYDTVVSDALPIYASCYLGKRYKKNEFKVAPQLRNEEDKFNNRLLLYKNYSNCIDKILELLKDIDINISKDEFDHIIWYGLKG